MENKESSMVSAPVVRAQPPKRVRASSSLVSRKAVRADTSRQLNSEDAFSASGTSANRPILLGTPYEVSRLTKCLDTSNILKQCIAAYVTNIASYGYSVGKLHKDIPIDPKEQALLESFISAPNADQTLAGVVSKVVADREGYGYSFIEIVRDRAGRPAVLRSVKSVDTRLCAKQGEDELVEVEYTINRAGRFVTVREQKTFRRFVQIVNGKERYFKEAGDPRRMHMDTGVYEDERNPVPDSVLATEMIHFSIDSDEAYGIPRWINQLPSILGSRESEECNLRYFEDNTIPPIVITVAGGRLTKESYRDVKRLIESSGADAGKQHRMVLLEAVPETAGMDEKATVSLKIDKLTDARQSDGLFSAYDTSNREKVLSSFRLPPVAIGASDDHTYATANTASFLVETQVYAPERTYYTDMLNKAFVNASRGLGLKTCKLVSNVPPITNPESIVKTMTALNVMGALTPRIANTMADGLLGVDVPDYPKKGEEGYEEWMDRPIVFVTRGIKSQDGQSVKDPATKSVEDDGDVSLQQPEHGQE